MAGNLKDLTQAVLAFRDERNWAQFHSLRNLIVSLNLEAAELLELTQWKTEAEMESLGMDPESRTALADECADVLAYLLLVAERAGFDLGEALQEKLVKNARKYPIEKSYGCRSKYTELK